MIRTTFKQILILTLLVLISTACGNSSKNVFLSPNGSDDQPGTKQKPVRNLSRAMELVKDALEDEHTRTIHVYFREGEYPVHETVVLDAETFGETDVSLVFRPFKNEQAVITGGVMIESWQPASTLPDRFPEEAQGNIWKTRIDDPAIRANGLKTIFTGDTVLYSALSPGFLSDEGEREAGKTFFYYPDGMLDGEEDYRDIELVTRPMHPWVMNILPLAGINPQEKRAETTIPATYQIERMGWIHENEPNLWVLNSIRYLDTPGEWVFRKSDGTLWYWPLEGNKPGRVYIPKLQELIRIEGEEEENRVIRNVHIHGLIFQHAERDTWEKNDIGLQHDWALYNESDAMLRFIDTENCSVNQCTFRNSGSAGVRFDFYSIANRVKHSKFRNLGGTPVLLSGYGPGLKNLSYRNEIISNEARDCGQAYKHSAGIFIWQSGYNRIAHNLLHHLPKSGIVVSGPRPSFFNKRKLGLRELMGTIHFDEIGEIYNWDDMFPYLFARNNVLEYNEIHHVVEDMSDGNGIYLSGTGYHTMVRRNYLHHNTASGLHGIIRGDDMTRDAYIAENIIYKYTNSGIVIKHPNYVYNNYIIGFEPSRTPIGVPVPKNENLLVAPLGPVKGTELKKNICLNLDSYAKILKGVFNPRRLRFEPFPKLNDCLIDSNLYYSKVNPGAMETELKKLRAQELDLHSVYADPVFTGFEETGFRLSEGSPALRLGIKQIPFEQIGMLPEPSSFNMPEPKKRKDITKSSGEGEVPPNILSIWTDEQQARTLKVYGNDLIKTPNLDRLASESFVFKNTYVTQPVCTPARSSIMTGLFPHTNGLVLNNIPLSPGTQCFPELMDDTAYTYAYMGKWHLGDEIFRQHGFQEFVSIEDACIKH